MPTKRRRIRGVPVMVMTDSTTGTLESWPVVVRLGPILGSCCVQLSIVFTFIYRTLTSGLKPGNPTAIGHGGLATVRLIQNAQR